MKKKISKIISLFISLSMLLVVVSPAVAEITGTPSTPPSVGGVIPFIIDGESNGGNRTCEEVGVAFYGDPEYYEYSSDTFDNGNQYSGSFDPISWSTLDDKFVSWEGVHNGLAVIVKGSNDANVYEYNSSITSDSGLASPPAGKSGNPANLSNITFCWNPEEVEELSQWCSPGYWRQAHHFDSWPVILSSAKYNSTTFGTAGYSEYFVALTLSKLGQKQGDPNPTLLGVLQKPQWYGGAMFNAVGDLLSAAHPEVNFTGERVEDSCPLN